jgi:hypothetical protein
MMMWTHYNNNAKTPIVTTTMMMMMMMTMTMTMTMMMISDDIFV